MVQISELEKGYNLNKITLRVIYVSLTNVIDGPIKVVTMTVYLY